MRIYIAAGGLTGGGSERFSVNLANAMSEKGHKVYIATNDVEKGEYELSSSVERMVLYGGGFTKDVKNLIRSIREKRPDICVSTGLLQNLYLCIAGKLTHTKSIISERNDPKHDHISRISRILRFLLYRFADGYVFQTEGARGFYSKRVQKLGVVIHNPIKGGLPSRNYKGSRKIVAVGRLMPQKNYKLLLDAFCHVNKRHKDYSLHIYGAGLEENLIRKNIIKHNMGSKIFLHGFQDNVHEQICNADIYVLSSDFEGMPNSLMEAMAMGFPVVSTDCPPGGPAELIKNGYNGLLCKVGDVENMAGCINRLIEDRKLNERLSQNARLIMKQHNMRYICGKWIRYMDHIINAQ